MIPEFAQYGIRINSCGRLIREPDWHWPYVNRFTDYDLIFTWEGEGWAQHEEDVVTLVPGSLELLRPNMAYQAKNDPHNRTGICFFHFDFLDVNGDRVYPPEAQLPPRYCRLRDLDFIEHVLRQAIRLVLEGGDIQRQEAAQYLRAVMLKAVAETAVKEEPPLQQEQRTRIAEVTRHIRENPGQHFSVPALAGMASYSPDHFARIFKLVHGMSPKEFCIRARINRARELLAETNLSVERIATNLGYADIFFFSRQFKQRVGYSPCQWRTLCHRGQRPHERQQ